VRDAPSGESTSASPSGLQEATLAEWVDCGLTGSASAWPAARAVRPVERVRQVNLVAVSPERGHISDPGWVESAAGC
jgi:hypothetical protein